MRNNDDTNYSIQTFNACDLRRSQPSCTIRYAVQCSAANDLNYELETRKCLRSDRLIACLTGLVHTASCHRQSSLDYYFSTTSDESEECNVPLNPLKLESTLTSAARRPWRDMEDGRWAMAGCRSSSRVSSCAGDVTLRGGLVDKGGKAMQIGSIVGREDAHPTSRHEILLRSYG